MKKRIKLPKQEARKMFTKTASYVNPKNAINSTAPLRGGIRL